MKSSKNLFGTFHRKINYFEFFPNQWCPTLTSHGCQKIDRFQAKQIEIQFGPNWFVYWADSLLFDATTFVAADRLRDVTSHDKRHFWSSRRRRRWRRTFVQKRRIPSVKESLLQRTNLWFRRSTKRRSTTLVSPSSSVADWPRRRFRSSFNRRRR